MLSKIRDAVPLPDKRFPSSRWTISPSRARRFTVLSWGLRRPHALTAAIPMLHSPGQTINISIKIIEQCRIMELFMLVTELHDPRCVTDRRPGRFDDQRGFHRQWLRHHIRSPPSGRTIDEDIVIVRSRGLQCILKGRSIYFFPCMFLTGRQKVKLRHDRYNRFSGCTALLHDIDGIIQDLILYAKQQIESRSPMSASAAGRNILFLLMRQPAQL